MTDEQPEDRRAPEQGDFEGNGEKGSAEWSRPPTPLPSLSSQISGSPSAIPLLTLASLPYGGSWGGRWPGRAVGVKTKMGCGVVMAGGCKDATRETSKTELFETHTQARQNEKRGHEE